MKKFLTLLLLLSICLMPSFDIHAKEVRIKYNKLHGIAYNRKLDGKFKTNTATMFQMDDRIAYCIEPGVEILDNYYDIYTDWNVVSFSDDEDICDVKETEQQTETSKDLFFHGTLRSGQRLENEGNIVIVGDVNAGAEVVAGGNIVIFGKLRGLAHAGAQGRRDVLIAVNSLMPQQVRIGGKIAIIPRGREIEGPEIVRIEEDRIIVDSMG